FCSVISGKMSYNGSGLGAGGDFYHKPCYEAESSNLQKTVIRSTSPPLAPNRCWRFVVFFQSLSFGVIWSASFLGATPQYAVINASFKTSLSNLSSCMNVQPCLPHLFGTG